MSMEPMKATPRRRKEHVNPKLIRQQHVCLRGRIRETSKPPGSTERSGVFGAERGSPKQGEPPEPPWPLGAAGGILLSPQPCGRAKEMRCVS